MAKPRIFVDFHNADPQGRLRLNSIGTVEDLSRQQVSLTDGLAAIFYSEDVEADGTVRYSGEENVWVAEINWDAIRHQPITEETEEQVG
jgi:hypothetical protein